MKNIVLLHGWGASGKKLQPLGNELKKLGWNVFIPKLPGFEVEPPKSIWGLDEYVEYVLKKAEKHFAKRVTENQIPKQVQDDRREKYFVFGHSFGGRIAIKMAVDVSVVPPSQEALRPPARRNNLAGIILCATGGISRGNPLKRLIFFILAKAGKILLIIPPGARFWRKLLYKVAREHDYEKAEGVMRDVFKKIIAENLKPLALKIKVPTLVLWGEEDKMTPISDGKFISNRLPSAKFISFKNQGHQLPYKKPTKLAQEIEKWMKAMTNDK